MRAGDYPHYFDHDSHLPLLSYAYGNDHLMIWCPHCQTLAGSVAIATIFSWPANATELKQAAIGILEQGLLKGNKKFINQNVAER